MGDSRGRWEGDTLVVETTNLSELTGSFDPSAMQAISTGLTVTLTERFTRVDEDTLLYEYTVDDPAIFTRPFTVAVPMRRNDEPMFEYACHEGTVSRPAVCGRLMTGPGLSEHHREMYRDSVSPLPGRRPAP